MTSKDVKIAINCMIETARTRLDDGYIIDTDDVLNAVYAMIEYYNDVYGTKYDLSAYQTRAKLVALEDLIDESN